MWNCSVHPHKLLLACTHAHLLSQMCFLKGRTADKHSLSHNVLEFTSGSKGHRSWHHRLLGLPAKTTHDGRLVREKRELFVYNNGTAPTRYSRVVSSVTLYLRVDGRRKILMMWCFNCRLASLEAARWWLEYHTVFVSGDTLSPYVWL